MRTYDNDNHSNNPKANSMREALQMAEEAAKARQSPHNSRGNPEGILYRFGAKNANPDARGFSQLNKLCERVEQILNNVSVSIGGQPTLGTDRDSCSPYEDFFEKGHSEELKFGHAGLAIEVKFSIPGNLKLVIRNLTAEQLAKAAEPTHNHNQFNSTDLTLDRLVDLHYNPGRDSLGNGYNVATLPGNEHFMTAMFAPLQLFADANKLEFYVQGARTQSLTYVFLDQDLMRQG